MTRILGIDTWAGNQVTDYSLIHNVQFAILRGGQGNWQDADFIADWANYRSHKPDWKLTFYHVFDPWYTTAQHMARIRSYCPPNLDIPIVLDVELDRGYSNSTMRAKVKEMRDALKWEYQNMIFYTGAWWWDAHMSPYPSWQVEDRFWLARYPLPTYPRVSCSWEQLVNYYPSGWVNSLRGGGDPIIWQWSGDKFYLPGFSGLIDLNFFREDAWDEMFGDTPPVEPPTTSPKYRVIAPLGLRVRSCPGTDCPKLYTMPFGTVRQVYEIRNGWGRIGIGEWCSMEWMAKI